MCRNIHNLYHFDPPATDAEVHAAALQFVRKVSGFSKPSAVNEVVFNRAVDDIARVTSSMLGSLISSGLPKNREVEAAKASNRAHRRFPS
jgi:hypothetical protein